MDVSVASVCCIYGTECAKAFPLRKAARHESRRGSLSPESSGPAFGKRIGGFVLNNPKVVTIISSSSGGRDVDDCEVSDKKPKE